jgi:hypothetical protein
MSSEWKTLRIFISSTFRDMQAERDHLVRFVFPRLREDLLKRKVHMVDVDLRWGVTADQDAIELCMDEIDRCRPRFLCLLGGRYGWVPAGADRSITASEIHYAVLDKLDQPGFRNFYFRDPAVTNSIPGPYAAEYREPEGSPAAAALDSLKTRIRAQALPLLEYPCRWDTDSARITGLEAFGEGVYRDLIASVEAELGPVVAEGGDEFAEEAAAMEAFVESRIERYVLGSRAPVLEQLMAHAESGASKPVLVLTGEPGSGKSALLGQFYRDLQNRHPDSIVLAHFTGVSPASTNIRKALQRLCHALSAGAFLSVEIPDDHESLCKTFEKVLCEAGARKRVVLIIDAVNQLDAAFHAHAMNWLPRDIPESIRVILSTLPGPALDALCAHHREAQTVWLRPLDRNDAAAIIDGFLARYRKTLDGEQRSALLAKEDAGTPLYLLTALEELRTLGGYGEITERIRQLPGRVQGLFSWVLERLEGDLGFRDKDGRPAGAALVRRYGSAIACGRGGMAQSELVDLVDPGDALGNVAALQRLLRPYLMQRGDLLNFYHQQLGEAVEKKYLSGPEDRRRMHHEIAVHFRAKADPDGDATWTVANERALSVLPYHLTEAEKWAEVRDVLTDLAFLEAKCTRVAVSMIQQGSETRQVYGGVYELQEDYRRAIEKLPA